MHQDILVIISALLKQQLHYRLVSSSSLTTARAHSLQHTIAASTKTVFRLQLSALLKQQLHYRLVPPLCSQQ